MILDKIQLLVNLMVAIAFIHFLLMTTNMNAMNNGLLMVIVIFQTTLNSVILMVETAMNSMNPDAFKK